MLFLVGIQQCFFFGDLSPFFASKNTQLLVQRNQGKILSFFLPKVATPNLTTPKSIMRNHPQKLKLSMDRCQLVQSRTLKVTNNMWQPPKKLVHKTHENSLTILVLLVCLSCHNTTSCKEALPPSSLVQCTLHILGLFLAKFLFKFL